MKFCEKLNQFSNSVFKIYYNQLGRLKTHTDLSEKEKRVNIFQESGQK